MLDDMMTRYRGVGWGGGQQGMGFLTFRRGPRCRGSRDIGNNCKTCWHCLDDPLRPANPLAPAHLCRYCRGTLIR